MRKNSRLSLTAGEITPHKWYRLILIVLVVAGIAWYAAFQARNLIEGPSITLSEPHAQVQTERMITVSGVAENIVALSLNGKNIFTDESGAFEEALVLENGYTIMTLTATDRYGRTTRLSRPYVYIPASDI